MNRDFIGFSFDGIHSSELGILRVTGKDRYDEDLFPEMDDATISIPGNSGEYFFRSNYKTREFSISIAYDSVTETQFRKIRRLFGQKKVCRLIFDERPYKVYYAKVKKPVELNYICFDEHPKAPGAERDGVRVANREFDQEGAMVTHEMEQVTPWETDYSRYQRIYKGEGEIEFVCYFPFAIQQFKTLDLYTTAGYGNLITTYDNVDEWAESSGLLTQAQYDDYNLDRVVVRETDNEVYNLDIPVYNPGDLNTGFFLYIPYNDGGINPYGENEYIKINGDSGTLVIEPFQPETNSAARNETGIIINTVNHLIEGVTYNYHLDMTDNKRMSWQTTGNIYNKYIKGGTFPIINRTDWIFDTKNLTQAIHLSCDMGEGEEQEIRIHYDYLYF